MKLKICVIPTWYPSSNNPFSGIFIRDHVESLAKQHQVSVLYPELCHFKQWFHLPAHSPVREIVSNNLELWHIQRRKLPFFHNYSSLIPASWSLNRYFSTYAKAAETVFNAHVAASGMPDLIHAHVTLPAGWAAVQLGQKHSLPVVISEHTFPNKAYEGNAYFRRMATDVLKRANQVIAVSSALADALKTEFGNIPVDTVGNVISARDFYCASQRQRGREPFRFFSACVLLEDKGIQFLLRAAHQLLQFAITDFEVIIGGDGPYKNALINETNQLGLENHCRFVGMLPREQMRARMHESNVFVLPSLCETFGMVVAEALLSGRPVIGTRCGGPEMLITPATGVLVPPGDSFALATEMARHYHGLYRYSSETLSASIINRFGNQAFLARMNEVYANMIRNHLPKKSAA